MKEYYEKHKKPVILIPSVFDFSQFPSIDPEHVNTRRVLAYAGSIANGKDSIHVVVRALAMLEPEEKKQIEFSFYGSTRDQLIQSLGNDSHILEL